MSLRRLTVRVKSLFQWRPSSEWFHATRPRTRRALRSVEALESRVVLASTTITLPSGGVFELSLAPNGNEAVVTQYSDRQAVAEVARLSGQQAAELQIVAAGGSRTQFIDRLPSSNTLVSRVQFVGNRLTRDKIFILNDDPDESVNFKVLNVDAGRATTLSHTLQFRNVPHVVWPAQTGGGRITLTDGDDRASVSDNLGIDPDPIRSNGGRGNEEYVSLRSGGLRVDFGLVSNEPLLVRGLGGDDGIGADSTSQPVILQGGLGNDTLFGGAGADSLEGNGGADRLIASGYSSMPDTLNGGPGIDQIESDVPLLPVIVAYDVVGFVTINGTQVSGRTEQDLINVSASVVGLALNGSDGDDRIDGSNSSSPLVLRGRAGNDTLIGSVFADQLLGGDGNDSLLGRDGDDSLNGGWGQDQLEGEDGINTAVVDVDGVATIADGFVTRGADDSNSTDISYGIYNVVINGGDSDDLIDASMSDGPVEIHGGAGNDTIIGSPFSDDLVGEAGNDSLIAGAGRDFLEGNDGDDTLRAGADSESDDVLRGQAGSDLLDVGIGNAVVQVFVTSGATVVGIVVTGEGSDQIVGQSPNVMIFGGDNGFVLDASQSDFAILLYGGNGNDTLIGSRFNDLLVGQDGADVLEGREGDDSIYGNNGNDVLKAASGNDRLDGGSGVDTLDGGTGESVAEMTFAGLLGLSGSKFRGVESDVLLAGIVLCKIYGSAGDDYFYGSEAAIPVEVYGLGGNDTLVGSPGDDSLNGGEGIDVIRAGNGNDTVNGGEGDDRLFGDEGDDKLRGDDGQDSLRGGAGYDQLVGGDGADTLYGGDGNDTTQGGDGDDQLLGQAGDDLLSGGNGIDGLFGGDGNNSLLEVLEDSTSLVLTNETLTSGGVEQLSGRFTSARITGSTSNSFIDTRGFDGPVTVLTGAGNDTVLLGSGDDQFTSGGGNDVVDPGTGSFTIYQGVARSIVIEPDKYVVDDVEISLPVIPTQFVLVGWIHEVHMSGQVQEFPVPQLFDATHSPARVTIEARSGDDTILGSAFADSIDGGSGNDRIDAGGGDDTIVAGDGDDTVNGQSGNDALSGGLGNDRLTGEDGRDTLLGGAGHDTLSGGALNDVLLGEDGDDRLVGQGGSKDTLAGGLGEDTLIGAADEIDEAFTFDFSQLLQTST